MKGGIIGGGNDDLIMFEDSVRQSVVSYFERI